MSPEVSSKITFTPTCFPNFAGSLCCDLHVISGIFRLPALTLLETFRAGLLYPRVADAVWFIKIYLLRELISLMTQRKYKVVFVSCNNGDRGTYDDLSKRCPLRTMYCPDVLFPFPPIAYKKSRLSRRFRCKYSNSHGNVMVLQLLLPRKHI